MPLEIMDLVEGKMKVKRAVKRANTSTAKNRIGRGLPVKKGNKPFLETSIWKQAAIQSKKTKAHKTKNQVFFAKISAPVT